MTLTQDLARALLVAEREEGWDRNKPEPWSGIRYCMYSHLQLIGAQLHTAKLQTRSARKSLWQGALHRSSRQVLFLAADLPRTEEQFADVLTFVGERLDPPPPWADVAFVYSDGVLQGIVERADAGVTPWLLDGGQLFATQPGGPPSDCGPLIDLNRPPAIDADSFILKLGELVRRRDSRATRALVANTFCLGTRAVKVSNTSNAANAAKGNWEGADVDPARRFRVAVVGAQHLPWEEAAYEISHRMDPVDLALDLAVVCARTEADGPWDQFRFLYRSDHPPSLQLLERLSARGVRPAELIGVKRG